MAQFDLKTWWSRRLGFRRLLRGSCASYSVMGVRSASEQAALRVVVLMTFD
jgi:hypothetical protein